MPSHLLPYYEWLISYPGMQGENGPQEPVNNQTESGYHSHMLEKNLGKNYQKEPNQYWCYG